MHHLIRRISPSCRTILWSKHWFPDTCLGQGADVVLGLIEKCEVKDGSTVTFDNLFTSFPLLHEPNELGIGALSTLPQNRCHGSPVSWVDNKVVTCATNYVTCTPVSTAERWSQSAKKRVDVPMPKPFEDYNKQMGGFDLFNQFVSTYIVRIRSKKWWWSFFAWAVNVSMANAWNFFRTVQKQKIGMLEFLREVAMTILASTGRNRPAKSLAFPQNVGSNMKLDIKNHIFLKGTSKFCRCKHCGGKSIYLCQKCNAAQHPDCFKEYHSWNTNLIALFSTGSANNVNPATIFRKI